MGFLTSVFTLFSLVILTKSKCLLQYTNKVDGSGSGCGCEMSEKHSPVAKLSVKCKSLTLIESFYDAGCGLGVDTDGVKSFVNSSVDIT